MEVNKDYGPPEYRPKFILLISGKRKCGKDFLTEKLLQRLEADHQDKIAIMKIANPIKSHWAAKHSLDYEKLLDTSEYKEKYRYDMVKWSMEVRALNYGYFPFEAIRMAEGVGKPLWICTDIRHRRDYQWFCEFYPPELLKRIRITADEEVRKSRGWNFTQGVDDGASECDLDHIQDWDLVVTNNSSENTSHVDEALDKLCSWIQDSLK